MRAALRLAGALLALAGPATAAPACDRAWGPRLALYCHVNRLAGQTVALGEAMALDAGLRHEGFARGLGLAGTGPRWQVRREVRPVLAYLSDINAGNPDRPIALGGLVFHGDPAFRRRAGPVAGLALGAGARRILGEGRYLDLALGASHARSPGHDLGIRRQHGSACLAAHLRRWWFADACLGANRLHRELDDARKTTADITLGRLFAGTGGALHEASAGLGLDRAAGTTQDQVFASLATLHPGGLATRVAARLSAPAGTRLAVRHELSVALGTGLFGRPLRLSASYRDAEGPRLLGVARRDRTLSVDLGWTVTPRLTLVAGLTATDSSIDAFDETSPVFGLDFAPLRF